MPELAGMQGSNIPMHALSLPFPTPATDGSCATLIQIIWCEEFHYWVMWFHLDLPSFGFPAVGVAKAETLQGPFEFVQVLMLKSNCMASAIMQASCLTWYWYSGWSAWCQQLGKPHV